MKYSNVCKYFFAFCWCFNDGKNPLYANNFRSQRASCKQQRLLEKIIDKKNLVWHSHNFLLPYITVEEYFINSITFIFNLYFICFVVDELPAFIVIVNIF